MHAQSYFSRTRENAYIRICIGRVKKGWLFNGAQHENRIFDFQDWDCFQFTMSQLRF